MNTHRTEGPQALDAREWDAQERALRDARAGVACQDPQAARYRAVVDALRQPLPDLLPPDFAAQVAARVLAAPPRLAPDAHLEGTLVRGLAALLGLSGAVTAALYGQQWLPAILAPLPLDSASALNWALALAACVGLNWLVEPLRRRVASR